MFELSRCFPGLIDVSATYHLRGAKGGDRGVVGVRSERNGRICAGTAFLFIYLFCPIN